jgi:hypothetical protein
VDLHAKRRRHEPVPELRADVAQVLGDACLAGVPALDRGMPAVRVNGATVFLFWYRRSSAVHVGGASVPGEKNDRNDSPVSGARYVAAFSQIT